MAMSLWKQAGVKRARRVVVAAVVLAPAIYFVPILTLLMIVCGVIDVRRHKKITYQLLEKYFLGNGLLTWMLSPLNLLADLLAHRNRVIYTLEDLPADHRREIETCVREFVDNGDRIKAHVAATLEQNKRCMLTFRWFNATQASDADMARLQRCLQRFRSVQGFTLTDAGDN